MQPDNLLFCKLSAGTRPTSINRLLQYSDVSPSSVYTDRLQLQRGLYLEFYRQINNSYNSLSLIVLVTQLSLTTPLYVVTVLLLFHGVTSLPHHDCYKRDAIV